MDTRPTVAWLLLAVIASSCGLACQVVLLQFRFFEFQAPLVVFVLTTLVAAVTAGLVGGKIWPARWTWLPWLAATSAYVALIVPNGLNLLNRAPARLPGEPPWEPAPTPWLLLFFGGVIAIAVSFVTGFLVSKRKAEWAGHITTP